ncbi:MAG: FliH/SctL family protein [Candidatus Latescibacterota bacterium]|nr:FliH/SctL family protein [Candidatus Latescibacterota bacterium]MEE2726071.1 FliH/SctL family protein [Candidatus Latescibacterota bacterium]
MSKVIRTARFAGPVVTVGQAERDLYVERYQDGAEGVDGLGLADLLAQGAQQAENALNAEWESKLQSEVSYVRGEGEKRLQEAEAAWQNERAQLNEERYEEGVRSGVEQCEAEVKEAIGRIEVLHQSLEANRAQIMVEAEGDVVDLVVSITRKILGLQAVSNPKALLQVVRNALSRMSEKSNLEIRVHPDDLAVVQRYANHWVAKVDKEAVLKVRESIHVDRGGCLIEGGEENIDARLEEQLETMHQVLRRAVFDQADTGEERSSESEDDKGDE